MSPSSLCPQDLAEFLSCIKYSVNELGARRGGGKLSQCLTIQFDSKITIMPSKLSLGKQL